MTQTVGMIKDRNREKINNENSLIVWAINKKAVTFARNFLC